MAENQRLMIFNTSILPVCLPCLGLHLALFLSCVTGCSETRRVLVGTFSESYEEMGDMPVPSPVYDGKDADRPRIPISLTAVANGLERPTDIQFDPSRPSVMVVLEQGGTMKWFDLEKRTTGVVIHYDVLTVSEQGLLGMAFHPDFPDTPLVYLDMVVRDHDADLSRILEVRFASRADLRNGKIIGERTILEVEQPYQNHNAGQLAFGPDGYLYIGFGDGGWAGDPHNNAQNPSTMLGKILRIDVSPGREKPYTIPPDNPFVSNSTALPEIWAIGLRNPWRYSFDPNDRLIVADVGQNKYEELDIIEGGKNYGWRLREGKHCYEPPVDCERDDLVDPFYEYDHTEGESITGGYVYVAGDIPTLKNLYVFGDFITGRLWALGLPESASSEEANPEPFTLGRWQMLISTFGRDPEGRVYFAEFGHGVIYRLDPPTTHPDGR